MGLRQVELRRVIPIMLMLVVDRFEEACNVIRLVGLVLLSSRNCIFVRRMSKMMSVPPVAELL